MRKIILSGLALTLVACAGTVAPPDVLPSDVTTYPEITNKGYASHIVVQEFNVPREWLRNWLNEDTHFVNAMEETENIKKPVEITILSGTWPEPGATRRVVLSDGHATLERVIQNDYPGLFQYQIWGLTSKAGQNLSYVLGTQIYEPINDGAGTRLNWTYALKPDAGFKKPFVSRFVNSDIRPFLDNAAAKVARQAEAEYKRRQAAGET